MRNVINYLLQTTAIILSAINCASRKFEVQNIAIIAVINWFFLALYLPFTLSMQSKNLGNNLLIVLRVVYILTFVYVLFLLGENFINNVFTQKGW